MAGWDCCESRRRAYRLIATQIDNMVNPVMLMTRNTAKPSPRYFTRGVAFLGTHIADTPKTRKWIGEAPKMNGHTESISYAPKKKSPMRAIGVDQSLILLCARTTKSQASQR